MSNRSTIEPKMFSHLLTTLGELRSSCVQVGSATNHLRNRVGQLNRNSWNSQIRATIHFLDSALTTLNDLDRSVEGLSNQVGNRITDVEYLSKPVSIHSDVPEVSTPYPVPTPMAPLTPNSTGDGHNHSLREVIETLETMLNPIAWVEFLQAEKQFRLVSESIGRLMNYLGQTRGNIKLFGQLSDFLLGASKGIHFLSNILSANDFRRFRNGELTNREMAKTAMSVLLFPVSAVPGIGSQIVDWYANNVPSPEGHWHGFAPEVGGDHGE